MKNVILFLIVFSVFYSCEYSEKVAKEELYKVLHKPSDFEFKQLIKDARKNKKPLLIYFTGYACGNAVKFEDNVLTDTKVYQKLKNYHCVALYVDDDKELPKEKWKKSTRKNRMLKTLGNKSLELEVTKFKNASQPLFVMVKKGHGYRTFQIGSKTEFLNFLN